MMPAPNTRDISIKCPHCDAQPCNVGIAFISFDRTSHAAVFICGACQKILGVSAMQPPAPASQRSHDQLIIPRRDM